MTFGTDIVSAVVSSDESLVFPESQFVLHYSVSIILLLIQFVLNQW